MNKIDWRQPTSGRTRARGQKLPSSNEQHKFGWDDCRTILGGASNRPKNAALKSANSSHNRETARHCGREKLHRIFAISSASDSVRSGKIVGSLLANMVVTDPRGGRRVSRYCRRPRRLPACGPRPSADRRLRPLFWYPLGRE